MSSQETQLIVVIGKDKQFGEDKNFPIEQVFFAIAEALNRRLHLYAAYKDESVEITINKDGKIEPKSSLRSTVKLAQKVFNEIIVIDSEKKKCKCKLLLFSALSQNDSPVWAALIAWQTAFKLAFSATNEFNPIDILKLDNESQEEFFSFFEKDATDNKGSRMDIKISEDLTTDKNSTLWNELMHDLDHSIKNKSEGKE